MTPAQQQKVKELFAAASEHDPATRDAFLIEAADGDDAVLQEVRSLLAYDTPGTFVSPLADTGSTSPGPWMPPSLLAPGAVVKDRYVIERFLAGGGFGSVYTARDRDVLGRMVIVKVQMAAGMKDAWWQKKFRDEAYALSLLDHPGIVTILDWGTLEGGQLFLVMQYAEGRTLRTEMQEGVMPFPRIASIARQIGDALDAVHHKGIWHRDLKPENVILQPTPDGGVRVRLIDFGIASIREPEEGARSLETRPAGTVPYMAPEQLMGTPSAAVDLYAFGVITYEMITGRRPYLAETAVSLYAQQQSNQLPPPEQFRKDVPLAASKLCLEPLAVDPEKRPQSAKVWAEALAAALERPPGGNDRGGGMPRRKALAILGIAGAAGVAAIAAYRSMTAPESTLKYWVEIQPTKDGQPNGSPVRLTPGASLTANDRVAFHIIPESDGHLYLVEEPPVPTNGVAFIWLSPGLKPNGAAVRAGQEVRIPTDAKDWLALDQQKGEERFWLIWRRDPANPLETVHKRVMSTYQDAISDPDSIRTLRSAISGNASTLAHATVEGETTVLKGGPMLAHAVRLNHD